MASTKYIRSLALFTVSSGVIDSQRFGDEISDSSIVIALDFDKGIIVNGTECEVWFKAAISAEDETTFDGLVAVHSGEPMPPEVSPVILEPTGNSAKSLQMIGVEFEADLGIETSYPIQFEETRDLQGVSLSITNNTHGPNGDGIKLAIEAPNGVGGWVEVRVLACGLTSDSLVPIPASGSVVVVSEGTATVPSFLRIMIRYSSVSSTGEKPLINLMFRTWA